MLVQSDEARAEKLMELAREDVAKRWNLYRQMAEIQYKSNGDEKPVIVSTEDAMVDLTTTYLGLQLKNPVVASASPISKKLSGIRSLEDAGASAVVMYSLFEEQIVHESLALDHYLNQGTESYAESVTYFPDLGHYNVGPEDYLELIHKAKQAVNIPVIGSLNGYSTGGWVEYAKKIAQAGADALELNVYYLPTDLNLTSQEAGAVVYRPGERRQEPGSHSLAIKLNPISPHCPICVANWCRPARTVWCCSIASCSPIWILKRSR
jgi:hypothetical protein